MCLSVYHTQLLYLNGYTDRADFLRAYFLRSMLHRVLGKSVYFLK